MSGFNGPKQALDVPSWLRSSTFRANFCSPPCRDLVNCTSPSSYSGWYSKYSSITCLSHSRNGIQVGNHQNIAETITTTKEVLGNCDQQFEADLYQLISHDPLGRHWPITKPVGYTCCLLLLSLPKSVLWDCEPDKSSTRQPETMKQI